jgi:predicted DsbA family dithiol-disulfide isomerase
MSNTVIHGDKILSAPPQVLAEIVAREPIVLHWYDLTCPFCYLGQARTEYLQNNGVTVAELPFQAHPDIPKEGVHIGERVGVMYEKIESDAAALHLPLNWPPRLPNSRLALSAAEWVRRNETQFFAPVQSRLFRAHFADGLDIGNLDIVLRCVSEVIGDNERLHQSLSSGEAAAWLSESEHLGHQIGVTATPTWLLDDKVIRGFVPEVTFDPFLRVAEAEKKSLRPSQGDLKDA